MFLIVFAAILTFINIFGKGSNIGFAIYLIIISLGFYLQKFISQAVIDVELTKETISVKYLRQYIFRKYPDRIIPFDQIKSYKYQEDRNFDLFRITLFDNTDIDFWHFTFTKDDFKNIVSIFPRFVEQHNKHIHSSKRSESSKNSFQKIERQKTIYENATSPFLLILAFIAVVAISLVLILKKGEIGNSFIGLSAILGALFYIVAYFKYRKKNK